MGPKDEGEGATGRRQLAIDFNFANRNCASFEEKGVTGSQIAQTLALISWACVFGAVSPDNKTRCHCIAFWLEIELNGVAVIEGYILGDVSRASNTGR